MFRKLLVYSAASLLMSSAVATATPRFELIPDTTVVFRDSLFVLDLRVDASSANLKAFSLEIGFNRSIIRTDSVSVIEGPHLATAGQPTFFWISFSPDSSRLYIDGAVLGDGFTVSGAGLLATITCYTIGFGETDIEFVSIRARDADNTPLLYDGQSAWVKVCQFVGDVNADNRITISDCVYLINWIFAGGPYPIPAVDVGDVDCDAITNISDVVYILNYIFAGGPAPCGPCY